MACGFDPLHFGQREPDAVSVNLYALVGYIPAPLGDFLDSLRCQLVPNCRLRSHVSFLPPRPILGSPQAAWQQIEQMSLHTPRFQVDLGKVNVFCKTNVIYLDLAHGMDQLFRAHQSLNQCALHYDEPFEYHPHITLAQKFPVADLARLQELAEREWDGYRKDRSFEVEKITFVQNNLLPGFDQNGLQNNQWIDLAECSLAR